jgi:hypothetical protein
MYSQCGANNSELANFLLKSRLGLMKHGHQKVDGKPLVIHTKKKVKLHTKQPKQSTIKVRTIYTVGHSLLKKKAIADKQFISKRAYPESDH